MTLFQILTVTLAALLLTRSVLRVVRGRPPRVTAWLGVVVWFFASVLILHPGISIRVANFLGIGRGADLVLYGLTITVLLSVFHFYNRLASIETNLTEIVRRLALSEALLRSPGERGDSRTTQKASEETARPESADASRHSPSE